MKLFLLTASLIVFSSFSQAQTVDILQAFQKECEASDIKSIIGETGSCRIIVVPQSKLVPQKGVCIGTFMGELPCVVNYFYTTGVGAVGLTCGTDPSSPTFDEEFRAEAVSFSVATLINTAAGNDKVMENNMNYTSLSSRMIDVLLTESSSEVKAKITINLGSTGTELSEVTCLKDI